LASPASIADHLLIPVNQAVRRYGLIADGDRILVGLSGGKDSRTLLALLARGVNIPGDYELVAVHVDGTEVGLPDRTPALVPWLEDLGAPYEVVPMDVPADEPLPMDCFRCSWNRRKTLFLTADRLGCNKVALGHHADDAAVTTLLSLFYKGRLETLQPTLDYFDGRFEVIRPLILVAEAAIRRYARACGWQPALADAPACPQEDATRRATLAAFLASFPNREREQIRANLWRAAHPDEDAG
jgi:tRNA 2-thiocytidine biosynthesis protein TtcA